MEGIRRASESALAGSAAARADAATCMLSMFIAVLFCLGAASGQTAEAPGPAAITPASFAVNTGGTSP